MRVNLTRLMLWTDCFSAYGTCPKIPLSGLMTGLWRDRAISKVGVSQAVDPGGVLCF
ncbi:hypothetical protein BCAR13_1610018 [Paraburkholderia caribensis]|nr:hypothetical protein BCAR13_1610018 [Paraburkholderia caribensis]